MCISYLAKTYRTDKKGVSSNRTIPFIMMTELRASEISGAFSGSIA